MTMYRFRWMLPAISLLSVIPAMAEDQQPEPALGPRLRVQFLESRQHGDKTLAARPYLLMLHADDKSAARLFVGAQVQLANNDKGAPTVLLKNVGIEAEVRAQTLADGRYRLEATFEESAVLGADSSAGAGASSGTDNPILQVVRSVSSLTLREGETLPFAKAIDSVSGDVVSFDVTVTAAPMSKTPVTRADSKAARARAQFVLNRRLGDKKIASRPYSVVVETDEGRPASVVSGSQLPLQITKDGQPTVMLKDIGAGARLKAPLLADGTYRLALDFSDGSLSMSRDKPNIRTFQCKTTILVRDGETATVASAVDPQTGETVEVEATIATLK
jgi:hypothetical protein